MINLNEIKDISLDTKVNKNNLLTIELINSYDRVLINKKILKELTGYDSIIDIFNLYDNKTYLTDFNDIDNIRNKNGELRIMDFSNFIGLKSDTLKLNNYHKDLLKTNKIIKTPINEDFINKKAYLNDTLLINIPNGISINKQLDVTNYNNYINATLSKDLEKLINLIKLKKFSKVDDFYIKLNNEFTHCIYDNDFVLSYWDINDKFELNKICNSFSQGHILYNNKLKDLNKDANDLLLKYILYKLNEEVEKDEFNINKIEAFHFCFNESYKNRSFTTLIYYLLKKNNEFDIWIIEFLELFQTFYENKMNIIKNEYEVLGQVRYKNFNQDTKAVIHFIKRLIDLHKTKANFVENHTLLDYCCERSMVTSNNFPFQQFLSILTSSNTNKFKIKLLHNLFYKVKKNKLNSLILYYIGYVLDNTYTITDNSGNLLKLIRYIQSYYTPISTIRYMDTSLTVHLLNEIAKLFNDNDDYKWNKSKITILELKHLLTVEEYFDALFFMGIFNFLIESSHQFNNYASALNIFLESYIKFIQEFNKNELIPKKNTFITITSNKYHKQFTIGFIKFLINGYGKI